MRSLKAINDKVLRGSESVLSYDGRIMTELLWEICQRLDYLMRWDMADVEVLDSCVQRSIGTAQTMIYQNNTANVIALKVYNIDPAQTVFVGKSGLTITGPAVPLFHETEMKLAVAPGDSVYGRVEAGTVDIRYSTFLLS